MGVFWKIVKNGYFFLGKLHKTTIDVSGADDLKLRLSAYARRPLSPEKTFIFFDEIQKCPEAVTMKNSLYIKLRINNCSY